MKNLKLLLIFPLLILISSCWAAVVGGVAGAGAVVYEQGQLISHEGAPFEKCLSAVMKSMDELGYAVEKTEKSTAQEKVIARTQAGQKVKITVKWKSKDHTELIVRVGTLGDEGLSRIILNSIRQYIYE